ncbi:hypothetical protein BDV95DRAFT_655957 [Massariosphaeria phaeospora]|uniref:Cell wall proline rich protein n=1 Tax=Massariosphaeria phaeospora TaxID=100035 RepID=A0A7C8I487_9PLEO|nr:hypothetical protein BDV95DRAFT_655957 [Massariosphaeria phaeospora]
MAQIALPRQPVTQTPQSAAVGSPLYQRRRTSTAGPIELIPNPAFSFPMRDPETTTSDTSIESDARRMSLQPYPTGRRGSSPALRQKSVSALPDFSFNPAGTAKPSVGNTPPHSPLVTPTTPSRPIGGHRRGGSEFIGGDGRPGAATALSSSPTKGDGILPPPNNNLRPGPPAGRRGHVHRRSGAISSHDLSQIMNPSAAPRAGSAPVTPLEGDGFVFGHAVNKSMSQPSLRNPSSFTEDLDSSRRPPSRARVGFADRVEYIRPLSTISSETETSMSTIRGHSATNSLSSVISASNSSPQAPRIGRPLSTTLENERRPSTAGAVLDMHKNAQFGGDLFNRKRPMSAVSPNVTDSIPSPTSPHVPTKRRGFFRLDSRRSDNSVPSLPLSASDSALSDVAGNPGKVKSASRKGNRKPRKVKSWANSIIPRKGKHGKKPKDRSATPPVAFVPDIEDTDGSDDLDFEANFDVDNTVTIVSPTESGIPERKMDSDIATWKPREFKRVDSDNMSQVIDLDAALGPFNTPNGSIPGGKRGFAAHRRAMHSAGGLLQNHRRTESAPELVPFELRTASVATTSTMADVFEEDEPDDEGSESSHKLKSSATVVGDAEEEIDEPKIQLVEADGVHTGSAINWNFDDGLRLTRGAKLRTQESLEPVSPFASSDSTITARVPSAEVKEAEPVMNVPLPLPQESLSTPDTFTSSFSSPDFRSSQASLDTPRLGTAASSLTDYYAMPSPRFGEPGPEIRVSVDDVPSLTSSRSTMTSAMQNTGSMMSPRRPGDRSASLCSAPSDVESRRRKRSSIASLSRLINSSSFSEKSKLSIEQRPQSEHLEPAKDPKKKHKRLSKLMQFWKPKDSSRS